MPNCFTMDWDKGGPVLIQDSKGISLCVIIFPDGSNQGAYHGQHGNKQTDDRVFSFLPYPAYHMPATRFPSGDYLRAFFPALPRHPWNFFATASTITAQKPISHRTWWASTQKLRPPPGHVPERHNIMGIGHEPGKKLTGPWHGDDLEMQLANSMVKLMMLHFCTASLAVSLRYPGSGVFQKGNAEAGENRHQYAGPGRTLVGEIQNTGSGSLYSPGRDTGNTGDKSGLFHQPSKASLSHTQAPNASGLQSAQW